MRSYRIIFHDDLIRKRIKVTVRLFSKNSEHDIQPLEILLPPVFGFFYFRDLCGTFVGTHWALLMATFVVILMPTFVVILMPTFVIILRPTLVVTLMPIFVVILMATFVVILMPAFVRSHINNAHIRSHIKAYIRKI